jgi:hypothetical protein
MNQIRNSQCTPVLGSGLTDHLFGSRREVAQRWAEIYRYPLAHRPHEDFPTVAQYLAAMQGTEVASNELRAYLHRHLFRRFGGQISGLREDGTLKDLVSAIGRWRRGQEGLVDPHAVLASLRCPVYITTSPDPLVTDALRDEGVEPVEGVFRWQDWAQSAEPRPGAEAYQWREWNRPSDPPVRAEPSYWPEPARPLVYYLFGRFSAPGLGRKGRDAYVITQDDFFEYLMAATRDKLLMPEAVGEALTGSALLFVGFQLTDWDFRVLLRSIRNRAGSSGLNRFQHVAVQIDPEEDQIQDAELARRYIERLSSIEMNQLHIFWGSIQQFVEQLRERLR